MKRDMDLVRKILMEIEEKHQGRQLQGLQIEGYDDEMVFYHCEMMADVGLLSDFEALNVVGSSSVFYVGGLTWQGQDYLEIIRNDEIWEKTIDEVEEKKIPKTLENIAKIAGIFVGNVISEMNG